MTDMDPSGLPLYGPDQAAVLAMVPQAIADNMAYLANDAPTSDDVAAQVRRLTRQNLALAAQAAGMFTDDITAAIVNP